MVLNEDRRRSFLRRLTSSPGEHGRNFRDLVNVEPVIVLVSCCLGFLGTSKSLFTYWARCVELAVASGQATNASSICASLTDFNGFQDVVEKDIANMQIWLQVASCIPTLITAPLIGSWSDQKGRKIPLIVTLFGFLMYNVFNLFSTFSYETVNIYYWFAAAEVSSGLCGGVSSLFATSLAIVTDDCRHTLKPGSSTVPLRIGIAAFGQQVGIVLGTYFFSLMTVSPFESVEGHVQAYVNSAVIQTSLCTVAFIYAIAFVNETHFPEGGGLQYATLNENDDAVSVTPPRKSLVEFIKSLLQVVTQPRPGWSRLCLNLSLLFIFVEFFAQDQSLLFLLAKRPPFSWTDRTCSNFNLIRGAVLGVGMVSVPLLLTRVRWLGKDSIMIISGIAAGAASAFIISFATDTFSIFSTAALAFLCGSISPGFRSFLPRMVSKEQTARLFTLTSIIITITPIPSSLFFNSIFNWSLGWWDGFAFFLCGLVQVTVVFGQVFVHILMRPQWLIEKRARRNLSFVEPVSDTYNREVDHSISSSSTVGSAAPAVLHT